MRYTRNSKSKLRFSAMILCLFVGLLLCSLSLKVFAQEKKSGIVPGRVIVKFKYDEIKFPEGESKVDIGRVNVRSATLKQALQRFKVDHFSRVVPAAVKGDTLRLLPNGASVKLVDFSQLHLLSFPADVSVDSVVSVLQKLEQVTYAEPDQIAISNAELPDDEKFDHQWYLHQDNDKDIDAPEAWELSKGDGIIIAIVDQDGVRTTHEDLEGKIEGGETTTDGNHGTWVAGVAAAETDIIPGIDKGIAGVGWNSEIIPYEFDSLSGAVNDINSAVSAGAHIINMSWSFPAYSQSLRDVLYNAAVQGRTSVAAAGNKGSVPFSLWPAAFDGLVISVSATNNDDRFPDDYNFGHFVDVAAPGIDIYTTDGDHDADYLGLLDGTSYSAAIVSGIVALLRAFEPELEDSDFERIIELSAEKVDVDNYPYDSNGWNDHLGHGRVNARQALDLVAANEIRHWTANGTGSSVNSTETGYVLFCGLPGGLPENYYIAKRYEVIKTVFFPESFSSTPEVWGRIVGTVGYNGSPNGANYSIPWCDATYVDWFHTILRTYVYEIWTIGGSYLGYYPTTPQNVQFAYTAFGTPGTPPLPPPPPQNLVITNPGSVDQNPILSWNASAGATSYNIYRCVTNWIQGFCQWELKYSTTNTTFTDMAVLIKDPDPYGDTIHYHVKAVNSNGESSASNEVTTSGEVELFKQKTGPATQGALPKQFTLHQNYPNPFNPTTEIRYELPENSQVNLFIFNLKGQKVRTLIEETQSPGYYNILWDGKDKFGHDVASGIYIYRIKVVANTLDSVPIQTEKKMTLLR